jgi:hypothetical protein
MSSISSGSHNPNPEFGNVPWGGLLGAVGGIVRLSVRLAWFFIKRPFSQPARPWRQDLERCLIRR